MEFNRRLEDRSPRVHGLISHMQTVAEREKAWIARELHDELGGQLVAASMDFAWLERHISSPSDEVTRRLARLKQALAGAVDMKRKIIEELRPTLLDNVGLFAALRWLMDHSCAATGVQCATDFPAAEPQFNPDASIALFRIAQEALAIALQYRGLETAKLTLAVADRTLNLSVTGRLHSVPPQIYPAAKSYELAAIRHRTAALGGDFQLSVVGTGEIELSACLPAKNTLAS